LIGSIFLFGGGGHMALMMAAYAPQLWRAVSSWCPITDLVDWHAENKNYAPHIAACCGGVPDDKTAAEYKDRSPIQHLESLMPANLSIHHGRFDISVPYTHTLKLAMQLEAMRHPKLFFEIFDGGHDKTEIAFNWFDKLHNATAGVTTADRAAEFSETAFRTVMLRPGEVYPLHRAVRRNLFQHPVRSGGNVFHGAADIECFQRLNLRLPGSGVEKQGDSFIRRSSEFIFGQDRVQHRINAPFLRTLRAAAQV
jgi:hypothetical protein